MPELNLLQKILIWVIPVIFAITVHEVAHGFVANRLGDPTAKLAGRLTLNPIKHIDLFGTIIIPTLLYLFGGFIFGWAKPVPVNWSRLRQPKRDSALVAFAGPCANLLMAFGWTLAIKAGIQLANTGFLIGAVLIMMGKIGVTINAVLLVLNLIPLPPLDGSRIVSSFLSPIGSYRYNQLESYGFVILLLLLATGILGKLLMPLVIGVQFLLLTMFNIQ